jgi:hypothetical protein
MDTIQQEFRTNKKAQAKVRFVVSVLPVIALALAYCLWPAHIAHSVLAFLRVSIAGLILAGTLMVEHMLLTE